MREELAALVSLTPPGIRHWIRSGVLPPARGRGRGARYTEEHVLRAQIAKCMQRQRATLRQIRSELRALSMDEIRQLHATLIPPASPAGAAGGLAGGAQSTERKVREIGLASTPIEDLLTEPALWDVIRVRRGLIIMASVEQGPEVRRLARQMCEAFRPIAERLPAK